MTSDRSPKITMRRASSLAFALLVLASYFAMFSSTARQTISLVELGIMLGLGVAYISFGIYGYNYAVQRPNFTIQLAYFAIQIPLGGLIVYLSRGAGFNALILLPLVGHSVILLSRRGELITNAVIIVTYLGAVRMYAPGWGDVFATLPTFLAAAVFILVFTQMAVSEERARAEVEHLVDELGAANQQLRDYAVQAEELAITKERNRLAREIHDGLGHYLTAIYMHLQAARAVLGTPPPTADQALANAQKLAQDALIDVRHSVASLRASPDENKPLDEAISNLIGECLTMQVKADFRVIGDNRALPPQTNLTLFRAAQEGLNNISKHARAGMVAIVLDYSQEKQVRLSIEDDGLGTDHIDGGFGLIGIKERAHLLGGSLEITSSVGQGFHLKLEVPG